MSVHDNQPPVPSAGAFPLPNVGAAEELEQQLAVLNANEPDDLPKVSRTWILFNTLAVFGAFIALVTPIAIALAIQVNRLAPGNEASLGVILGIGSLAAVIVGPLTGQLSDRTRSRFGRRSPWALGALLVGLVGLAIMGAAPNLIVLGVGWAVAQVGLQTVINSLSAIGADHLPESQRGKVGGLGGAASMAAPVFGAIIGGGLSGNPLLLFLVPGIIALILVPLFLLVVKEKDSRSLTFDARLTVMGVFAKYVFNPKRYPDYSWNWAGRFAFYFGLTLSTTFTAFFFSQRLGVPVDDIGGVVAIVGLVGIVGTMGGALASGFLSDKIRRRKPFVLSAAVIFALGSMIIFVAPELPLLVAGSFLCNLGIGVFSAVDQALVLDVLPEKKTDAGRFLAITQFATTIPQGLAPFMASLVITLGAAAGGENNYAILYVAAAVLTLLGGLLVLRVKSVR
ncbi:MFS transporter [Microbacterium sp. ProA8]|jgi:MFS family permease|uniref:MFS transporter n=1 Tax=Microbacterium chionoecetis TaxID=3153754 RepID=UPI003263B983